MALTIDAQETVEFYNLAGGLKVVAVVVGRGTCNADVDRGALKLGVGHLAGDGTFPNQFVQTLLAAVAGDGLSCHVGGAYGFVCLLGPFGMGVVGAALVVVGPHDVGNDRCATVEAEVGEVHRVGTHVGDES